MILPKSAADIEKKKQTEDILIVIQGNPFYVSMSEALTISSTIISLVAGKLKNGC